MKSMNNSLIHFMSMMPNKACLHQGEITIRHCLGIHGFKLKEKYTDKDKRSGHIRRHLLYCVGALVNKFIRSRRFRSRYWQIKAEVL